MTLKVQQVATVVFIFSMPEVVETDEEVVVLFVEEALALPKGVEEDELADEDDDVADSFAAKLLLLAA